MVTLSEKVASEAQAEELGSSSVDQMIEPRGRMRDACSERTRKLRRGPEEHGHVRSGQRIGLKQ